MDLELKHLDCYPKGKQGLLIHTNRRLESSKGQPMGYWEGHLTAVDHLEGITDPISVFDEENGVIDFKLSDIKPHWRPLSDLMEEIDHNEEKFIPLERLACKWDTKTDNEYFFEAEYAGERSYLLEMVPMMEQLLEWHFNVFDLPEELYIKK